MSFKILFCLSPMLQLRHKCPFYLLPDPYVTWDGLEPDKVASIWLLKRFVDSEAEFRFIAKGASKEKNEISFDVPEAQLRRSHTKSTFETILAHFQLQDERLQYIGRLIHDIEINTWQEKRMLESQEVEITIRTIIESNSERKKQIDDIFIYFDELLKKYPVSQLNNWK